MLGARIITAKRLEYVLTVSKRGAINTFSLIEPETLQDLDVITSEQPTFLYSPSKIAVKPSQMLGLVTKTQTSSQKAMNLVHMSVGGIQEQNCYFD